MRRYLGLWLFALVAAALAASASDTPAANHAASASDTPAAGVAAVGADSLWLRAVEIAAASRGWVPGLVQTTVEELDKQGEPKKTERIRLRLTASEDGRVRTEVIEAFENDRDITAKRRREDERRQEKLLTQPRTAAHGGADERRASFSFGGATPFDPGVQDSLRVERLTSLPDGETDEGSDAAAYHFEQQVGPDRRVLGTAWLDPSSGAPLRLRFAPDPFPAHVKELALELEFDVTPAGAWVPARMRIQAMGKMLLFTKRLRNEMVFSEHWWSDSVAAERR